jgi:hypothetical protein
MTKYVKVVAGLLVFAALLFAAKTFKALPGVYDPDHTGIISSAWVPGIGLPDAGGSNHGLYLAKEGPTETNAAAYAVIDGVEGITLADLGYDVKDGGHCSGGAPRFNVDASDGFHFVGACTNGTVAGVPAAGWTRYRFSLAQAFPPITPGATINSIAVLFDEEGSVIIDNIDVNDTLIGKPGNAK